MIETLEAAAAVGAEAGADALGPPALLASIRSRKAAEDQAAADVLELAARWADLHPPESIHSAASFTVPGCEHEESIAGPGTPLVAEFCAAELGTVLGITSVSAKKLIGHALELRHRLPRLWAQVHAGRVPPWRAGPLRGHHPCDPGADARGSGNRRRPGRRRGGEDWSRPAGPPRGRDRQAV